MKMTRLDLITSSLVSQEFQAKLFGFADFEHLGAAGSAGAGGSGFLVFHRDSLGTFHFFLSAAFNTVSFHEQPPYNI
jgi:hypothetical protein